MPEQIRIRMPAKSEQDAIAEALHLPSQHAATLWTAVQRIVSDIEAHQTVRSKELGGPRRKAWLRNAVAAFDDLHYRLGHPRSSTTNHLLRRTVLPLLAELLGHHGMERLAGGPIGSTLSWCELDERVLKERELDPAEVDRLTISNRLNVAAGVGPQLLQSLLVELSGPLRRQLTLEKMDKGGSPGRRYRNYVIQELIPVYERLYGELAKSTPSGGFANLCEQVLTSIGINVEGLDTAVSRILRNTRRSPAPRSSS